MKKFFVLVAFAVSCAAVFAQAPDANGIIYVKPSGAGNHSGTSWNNAIAEVADALIAAKTLNTALAGTVKEIWVASGTYKPLYKAAVLDNAGIPTIDKDKAFVLVPNMKLYGGFAGNETSLANRNLSNTNVYSVLSGDIGVSGNDLDNVYHVVISAGDVGTAELNGFVVTKGYATWEYIEGLGRDAIKVNNKDINRSNAGGVHVANSSPIIKNTIVTDNHAISFAGGIYIRDHSEPVIFNTKISNNSASEGGGIFSDSSYPNLSNLVFDNNTAYIGNGGGLWISSIVLRSINIENIVATNNVAAGSGAGIAILNASVNMNNIISNTNSASNGGGLFLWSSKNIVTNSVFSGNISTYGGGIEIINESSLTLANITITGNTGGGINSSTSLLSTLNNVTISGNLGTGLVNSNSSIIKIRNSIIYGNESEIFNFAGSAPEFTNSLIKGSGGSSNWNSAYGTNLGNNKDADPLFVSPILSTNTAATTTGDFRLKLASPAVDAGNNSFNTLTTDLDGGARIFRNIIDMGAYENHDGALPVALKLFAAEKSESSVKLSWKTTSETNTSHFEPQRSTDGKVFDVISTIKAKGESQELMTYSYNDYSFPDDATTIYYRLKMIDKDNRYAFSTIKSVKINDEVLLSGSSLYPNPVPRSNRKVILKTKETYAQNPTVTLSDATGRMLTVKIESQPHLSQNELDISGLHEGIYFVSIQIEGKTAVKKLVIE